MISEPYNDKTPMPFGAHIGKALANVPAKYLLWLYETSENGVRLSDKKLSKYIQENLEALKMEAAAEKQRQSVQRFFERK